MINKFCNPAIIMDFIHKKDSELIRYDSMIIMNFNTILRYFCISKMKNMNDKKKLFSKLFTIS